jgi:nitrogen-specific signal transduction histidine kinase
MFLIGYLAHDDDITAVQERLALAKPPLVPVVARGVPELIGQVQTLPLRAVIADVSWPRATWMQLVTTVRATHPDLPIIALAPHASPDAWWELADDLLLLDDPLELFLFRLSRAAKTPAPAAEPEAPAGVLRSHEAVGLLDNAQFRQFAQIFSRMDEATIVEAFVAWVQQACQTGRAVLMLRDEATGDFCCRAHRGLPSTLVPHCRFPQTAPICRWLMTHGRILLRDGGQSAEVTGSLDLLQALAAVPILFDGQLVGILGIGPRLVGPGYSPAELEGLFALAGHMAMALHNCRMHDAVSRQQEMTQHMLRSLPTGTLVLGADATIAFANSAAASIIGATRASLEGLDLRALPSPLGDWAYDMLLNRHDLPRRELQLATSGLPVAVSGFPLDTTPPSAMLLLEDLSAHKKLSEERERRVDLEMVTNLVHYLAHELRNPLVSLSTFGNLVPTRAADPDFQEFCASVLQADISRVNLILEQLLVLTNHAEYLFGTVALGPMLERVITAEGLRESVTLRLPTPPPTLYGDPHRLETAATCVLRTVARLAAPGKAPALTVTDDGDAVTLQAELVCAEAVDIAELLDPWQQLMARSNEDVDFGLATARYIVEQHGGTLTIGMSGQGMRITCRVPRRTGEDAAEENRYVEESPGRR